MKKLQNNNQTQLELLKQLLLEDELTQLKKLASHLSKLDIEWNDTEVIKQKIEPLYDDILLANFAKYDSQTVSIIARYLADIITVSTHQDIDKLSHALQEVISPAISSEIENNKDKMIDALYPIMGGMISKYVTQSIKELMENINQKIEDGLSFERYKRKLKSKLTGVSEVELLLEESSDANIESILIIHKETGLMIAESHQENKELDDAVMVASMASAIKDFVNDWMNTQDSKMVSEVQILSYGNATLYIESAGSVYMIAFMDAEPDYEQRKEINHFFAKILSKYSKLFQLFDGDLSNEMIPKLEDKLYKFLQYKKSKVQDSTQHHPNILKYILVVIAVAILGYLSYKWYDRYKLSLIEEEIATKLHIPIKLKHTYKGIEVYGYIKDITNYQKIEKVLDTYDYKEIYNYLHIPLGYTAHNIEDLNSKINELQTNLDILEKQNLQLSKQLQVLLKDIKHTKQKNNISDIHKDILYDLSKVFKNHKYYHARDGSLDIISDKLFVPSQAIPNLQNINQIVNDYRLYISTIFSNEKRKKAIKHIIIEGYTDSSGDKKQNLILSTQRAKYIRDYLQQLEVTKQFSITDKLISRGMGEVAPIIINGIEDKSLSRRIKIKFEL